MIDRQYRKFVLQCDTCGASEESDKGEEFTPFWNAKKRDGWRATKVGEDWQHECPDHRVK